jgi:hypothetical protein
MPGGPRSSRILPHHAIAFAALATLALAGCGWAGLIAGALTTPTSAEDASTNVAIAGGYAYVARSGRGIDVIDLATGTRRNWAPVAPADRVDDLALADGLLFALDATPPGNLFVFRVHADGALRPLAAPVPVPVGPFSGVAAGGGHVVVSGGTSSMTVRRYDADGALSTSPATADFGRGQPDVVADAAGRAVLVSTHVQGPAFGLTVADVDDATLQLHSRGYVALDGAGFTRGGFHPANFPLQAAWLDGHALVAHGAGLSVVAAPRDAAPRLLATLPLPVAATALAVDATRHTAYVVGFGAPSLLLEIDLAEPRAPRIAARRALPATGSPSAIALDATHLVVALQGGGVHVEARSAPTPALAATSQETSR